MRRAVFGCLAAALLVPPAAAQDGACTFPTVISPVLVAPRPGEPRVSHWGPAIVWTGSQYGIATYGRASSEWDIYLNRLGAAGELLGPRVAATMTPGDAVFDPAIAWSGNQFGITWDNDIEINFVRLDFGGGVAVQAAPVTSDPAASWYPSLAWNGAEYAIAWEEYRDGAAEIYLLRLDGNGLRVGEDLRVTDDPAASYWPALAWTGSDYGLVWLDDRAIEPHLYFTRLGSDGTRLLGDVPLVAVPGTPFRPSIVWAGTQFGLVWSRGAFGGDGNFRSTTWFARVDGDGVVIGSPISLGTGRGQTDPSIVWTGSEFGVAWTESDDAFVGHLRLARLAADGAPLGPPLEIVTGTVVYETALAWNGASYGIAWIDSNQNLRFSRVTCDCVDTTDQDRDGVTICSDCDDGRPEVHPGAPETCNGVDDNCDGVVDWVSGLDLDEDLVDDVCDNCPSVRNPDQADTDDDGPGDVCDTCPLLPDPLQADGDADRVGDLCDNCLVDSNPQQTDINRDGIGDACDTADGMIWILVRHPAVVVWDPERGYDSFNLYRGDLAALKAGGIYTQEPGSNDLAWRRCALTLVAVADDVIPPPGRAVFHLVSGVRDGVEGSLGTDSAGGERPNDFPCP